MEIPRCAVCNKDLKEGSVTISYSVRGKTYCKKETDNWLTVLTTCKHCDKKITIYHIPTVDINAPKVFEAIKALG